MRDFFRDPWQGVLAVLLGLAALGAWYATIIWLWERLDTDSRVALMVLLSIALYGYGWLMNQLVQRSAKDQSARRRRDGD